MLKALRLAMALATLVSVAAPAAAQHLRVLYPDIEQGAATLVVSPTGQAALIDGGTGINPTDEPIEDFINDLMERGIVSSLDYVIATHYDEDHIGRLENVFQLVPLSPSIAVYDRGTFHSTPTTFAYSDYSYWAGLNNRGTITPNTTLNLGGGVTLRCYVVNGDLPNGTTEDVTGSDQFENSASVAVVVEYGDFQAWIGGDLTGNPAKNVTDMESLVAPFVGDVDVYTFNHHGSDTSSNQTFLSALKAEVGINQNSVDNSFGHPRANVVSRFLATNNTFGTAPYFFQQNRGDALDTRSDDSLASGIADCDDFTEVVGLPGTIQVISDGASYEVSGCGFGALTLPADSGSGLLGDFPPSILRVDHSPRVPTAVQSPTVSADLMDAGIFTARLLWSLDGVAQSPITLTHASGDTYTASIPAQTDGTLVTYRVEVTDNASQTELSPKVGYFSGTTPIATLRSHDANGVLLTKHFGVRVAGNITAEPGLFNGFVSQIYVQDASGGVQIFDRSLLPLDRGDLTEFVGEIEQFAGQAEINISEAFGNYGHTDLGPGSAPAPQVVTVSQIGEALEGKLVRINGVTVVSGTIPETGNGNVEISDDGGVSTLTLRIDGDTDIPGANTPTQSFDVVGIASQFDGSFPFDYGYQLVPRERADLLTQEVNLPDLLINEVHADPHSAQGDANGDGTVSSTQDEFIELVNTTFGDLDISGWELHDGVGLRHAFASGTVVPAREAVVVFSGGTPTGDFGNAAANGLVFTASSGALGLNNTGDTVTLYDDQAAVVQTTTYGSEGGNDQSLTRDPDLTNTPFVKHTTASGAGGGVRFSPGTRADGSAFTVGVGDLLLTEVMYDPNGSDGGLEWIEIYNATGSAIDLANVSLGAGGGDYTNTVVQLDGVIAAGATFVVGGPTSSVDNANPTFDQTVDWSPDLQNSGSVADGVALFNLRAAFITPTTVPIDAVVYGSANTDNLIDETGSASAPEVGDAPSGATIERTDLAGSWQIQAVPTPNSFPGSGTTGGGGGGGTPQLILTEVLYDVSGGDDGYEWVEIHNAGSGPADLSGYCLAYGGSTYGNATALSGTLAPGATIVVGGPTSSSANGNPTFDLVINFSPDLQNSGADADAVALFDVPAASWSSVVVPIDAVIYGSTNTNGLIDETGSAGTPDVGDAGAGSSIERTSLAGAWQIQSSPTPNSIPF